jgi:molybdopterin biosynthesis enzyme
MVHANGLIVLPEDAASVKAGDMVTVQLIDPSLFQTNHPEYL